VLHYLLLLLGKANKFSSKKNEGKQIVLLHRGAPLPILALPLFKKEGGPLLSLPYLAPLHSSRRTGDHTQPPEEEETRRTPVASQGPVMLPQSPLLLRHFTFYLSLGWHAVFLPSLDPCSAFLCGEMQ
jgi:hypothetical protein